MKIKPKKEIIIIKHQGGIPTITAYDILIKKGFKHEFEKSLYKVDCSHVKKFIKSYPEYEYIGGEDDGHIPEFNWIGEYVGELMATKKAQIIYDFG